MKLLLKDSNWRVLLLAMVVIVVLCLSPLLAMALMQLLAKFWSLLIVLAHVLFAVGIAKDARQRQFMNQLMLFDALTWALAVLIFGLVAVAFYWLVHYSNLRGA